MPTERNQGFGGVIKLVLLRHMLPNPNELGIRVVGEVDLLLEARSEARISLEELTRLIAVSRHDCQAIPVLLQNAQEFGDRFEAEVPTVSLAQGVGLVDEQNSAKRFACDRANARSGPSDVALDRSILVTSTKFPRCRMPRDL